MNPPWDWPPTSWTNIFSIAKEVAQEPAYHYPGGTGCEKGAEDCQQGYVIENGQITVSGTAEEL